MLKRLKHPGESVRANEAVIELGDLSKLCAEAYVPLDTLTASRRGRLSRSSRGLQRRVAASRCRSRRSGSAARSRSSIPRSSPSPRRPCGSGPSSRTRASCGPGLKVQMTIFLHAGRRGRRTRGGRAHRPGRLARNDHGEPAARAERPRGPLRRGTSLPASEQRGLSIDECCSYPGPLAAFRAGRRTSAWSSCVPTWSCSPSSTRG